MNFDNVRTMLLSHKFLYNKTGGLNANLKKSLSKSTVDNILALFTGLEFSPAVYCIIYNIREVPVCLECNSPVKSFYNFNLGFSKFCSLSCSRKNNISKDRRKKTNLEKYGVENPKQNADVQERTRLSNIEKYGVDSPNQLPEMREKIANSVRQQYATSHNEIVAKKNATFNLKYGMHPNLTESVKRKKIVDTFTKYGVEHTTQLALTKDRYKATILEKYGFDHYSKTAASRSAQQLRMGVVSEKSNTEFLSQITNLDTEALTRQEISDLTNIPFSTVCVKLRMLSIPVKASTFAGMSAIEVDIVEYIKSLGITDIVTNTRAILDSREIDIYLPEHSLAIEVNGIYWHSEKFGKDYSYHISKTTQCKDQSINLLHIFDTEWTDPTKQAIWKSMISSRLKLNSKIHARKCIVKDLNTATAMKFFNDNHLQGFRGGKIKLGLYYNDILVQAIIVGASRYNKKYEHELIRAATIKNHNVIGGLSKLLNNITGSLISYADRRYSNGSGYEAVGMRGQTPSPPNYFYLVNSRLESRVKYQKHKLKELLTIFDNNMTEAYNMNINGFYRVWDCGNLVYTRERKIES